MELPEGFIAAILRHTTPLDVARMSVVSKIFRSAANSDTIWDHFLPSDYQSIISHSPSLTNVPSKKALYLALSDHPIIIDHGKKSFQLDRKNGKKFYMLAARALSISTCDDELFLRWVTMPKSRFEKVVKPIAAFWDNICGKINTVALSSNTMYAAFLVFKLINTDGSRYAHVLLSVGNSGGPIHSKKVCLDLRFKGRCMDKVLKCPKVRSDGLLEIKIGDFYNSGLEDDEVEMSAVMRKSFFWNGLFYLEGIEVRPKISGPRRN